ncbi:MAG: FliM/FliN family flagellar motor switch protein [Novosphingobium sp.]
MRLIDRAFGGRGDIPEELPAQFPVSGELLMAKLEQLEIGALSAVLGGARTIQPCRRDTSIARLAPFAETAKIAVTEIEIVEETAQWRMHFAIPLAALSALFGKAGSSPARRRMPGETPLSIDAPFDDVPLPLHAVLVDMRMPVSKLAELVPGQVLPVPVARSVPLRTGERTIAHGAIGTMEDRVAVRITQTFQQQESTQ